MPCPLCDEVAATTVEQTTYDRIWSALASDLGAVFDPAVLARHTPAAHVELLECSSCGLRYFSPALPGDADFYHQLSTTSASYYSEARWDFHKAIELVAPGDVVLDIACGGGAWLQQAQNKGAEVCGIDTNPAAITRAREAGLHAQCLPLDEFTQQNSGRFDVVTAFHVIEHIPAIRSFVDAAKDCLKPGGKLILTVPNRLRRFRTSFEPLDYPPHHLSHWTANQLIVLARLTGLHPHAIYYEPGSMADCRALLRNWIAPAGQAESMWARAIARGVFGPLLYSLYRRAGLLDRWQLWRMSVMAVLGKSG